MHLFSTNKAQRCSLQVTTGRCLGRIHISSDLGCCLWLLGLSKTWILAITTFCTACPLSTHCFPYGRLSSAKEKKYDLICWILQRTNSTNFEIKLDNRNKSCEYPLKGYTVATDRRTRLLWRGHVYFRHDCLTRFLLLHVWQLTVRLPVHQSAYKVSSEINQEY